MGQVAAVIEAHAENRVAGIEQREIRGGVRLRAGVGLHVGIGRAEQLLGALDGQPLGDVDVFAAAVVAAARVSFGVFIGEHRALRLEHPRTRVVLGRDQFDVVLLTAPLSGYRLLEFGVEAGNRHLGAEHGGLPIK